MDRRLAAGALLLGTLGTALAVWLLLAAPPGVGRDDHLRTAKIHGLRPEEAAKLRQGGGVIPPLTARIPREQVGLAPDGAPPAAPDGPGEPDADPEPGVYPLDADGVRDAVAERMPDLEGCYETARLHTPGLAGKVTLVLDVVPAPGQAWATVGKVRTEAGLDTRGTGPAPVFEACLATVFEELRFDAREATTIRYPVDFQQGEP